MLSNRCTSCNRVLGTELSPDGRCQPCRITEDIKQSPILNLQAALAAKDEQIAKLIKFKNECYTVTGSLWPQNEATEYLRELVNSSWTYWDAGNSVDDVACKFCWSSAPSVKEIKHRHHCPIPRAQQLLSEIGGESE